MPQAIATFLVNQLAVQGVLAKLITAVVTVAVTVGLNTLANAIFARSGRKPSDGQQNTSVSVGSRVRHYGIVHTGSDLSFLDGIEHTVEASRRRA